MAAEQKQKSQLKSRANAIATRMMFGDMCGSFLIEEGAEGACGDARIHGDEEEDGQLGLVASSA